MFLFMDFVFFIELFYQVVQDIIDEIFVFVSVVLFGNFYEFIECDFSRDRWERGQFVQGYFQQDYIDYGNLVGILVLECRFNYGQ